jgi:hypothetical protein
MFFAVWRPAEGDREFSVSSLVKWPLSALAVVAGLFGAVGLAWVAEPWRRLLGVAGETGAGVQDLLVSGTLAVVTFVLVGRWRSPALHGSVADWLYLERMVERGVVRPVLALADALARFDDRVVDGGVRAVAAGGRRAADLTARRVEFPVDGLVNAIGRAARSLGALARRPQTGLVHTYYAQAAVLLVVLAVVIVVAG